MATLRIGIQKGYRNYRIYGALGGRVEVKKWNAVGNPFTEAVN